MKLGLGFWILETILLTLIGGLSITALICIVYACSLNPILFYGILTCISAFVLVGLGRLLKVWSDKTFDPYTKSRYPWEE